MSMTVQNTVRSIASDSTSSCCCKPLIESDDNPNSCVIPYSKRLPQSLVVDVMERAPSIRHLELNFAKRHMPSWSEIGTLSRICNQVASIHVSGKYVSENLLKEITQRWPKLTSLTIEGNAVLDSDNLFNAIHHLKGLTHLSLISCSKVSNYFVSRLVYSGELPIESLYLKDLKYLHSYALGTLNQLKTLRKLEVSHIYELDRVLKVLKNDNPNLVAEEIDEGCMQSVIYAVQDLWQDCSNILNCLGFAVFDALYSLYKVVLLNVVHPIEDCLYDGYRKVADVVFAVLVEIEACAIRVRLAVGGALFDAQICVEDTCYRVYRRVRDFFYPPEPLPLLQPRDVA